MVYLQWYNNEVTRFKKKETTTAVETFRGLVLNSAPVWMGDSMFAYEVVPSVGPVAFLNPSLHRDLAIVPITVLQRRVCVCALPNPLFKPPLPPLLPFLFHTLSAVLTHSFWAGPKSGRAAPQSGTLVLKLTRAAETL